MWFVVFVFVFIHSISQSYATNLTVSNLPASSKADDSITIDASFSGSKSACANKTYFLRGAFFVEGTTRYFGLTENNLGNWIKNPQLTSEYFSFTTSEEGSWSGRLKVKPDSADEAFIGAGSYGFKVGRYTQTGSSVTEWSNQSSLELEFTPLATPQPTPTSTASPSPTPDASPTSQPISPTSPPASPPPSTPKLEKPTPSLTTLKVGQTITPPPSLMLATRSASISSPLVGSVAGTIHYETQELNYTAPIVISIGGLFVVMGLLPMGWNLLSQHEA